MLNYFDELEIHPETFEIPATQCEVMLKKIKKEIGEPRNYGKRERVLYYYKIKETFPFLGPTPEELAEMQRKATEERVRGLRM